MFNIGFSELIVIGVLALLFIGPKQLPEVARTVGRLLNELKRAGDEALDAFKEAQHDTHDYLQKTTEVINEELVAPTENSIQEKTELTEAATEKQNSTSNKEDQNS